MSYPVTGRFAGQVAVVTGGASGIGAATARRLAAEGAAVTVVDVADGVADVVAGIGDDGGRAQAVTADVSDEDAWQQVVAHTRDAFGPVDVLVSNAVTAHVAPAHETSRSQWDRQLAVNLTGSFLGVRACHDDLRQRRGAVILVSSVHALVGLPGHPAYAAAKAGLTGLARQLAVEYGPEVRVNAVLPGPILTPAWDRVTEQDRARSVAETVAGRFGTPAEVAGVVAFLACADAGYVTGASVVVDGGWSIYKASA